MEWRPQKEGIATHHRLEILQDKLDGMETSKRRDCDPEGPGSFFLGKQGDGMETSKRRDCDAGSLLRLQQGFQMEWRPQKEGIATREGQLNQSYLFKMEWRPQKEGIATQ